MAQSWVWGSQEADIKILASVKSNIGCGKPVIGYEYWGLSGKKVNVSLEWLCSLEIVELRKRGHKVFVSFLAGASTFV